MENGTIIFMLALVLLLGMIFGKLAKIAHLPSVTGYLLAGILFGPYLVGSLHIGSIPLGFSEDFLNSAKIISTVAFSFICFSLGEEISPKKLKIIGRKAVIISTIQALAATILAGCALTIVAVLTKEKFLTIPAALVLGALAAASAPTAKFMITRQYKTEGEITDMMAPVVALDDVIGIIIFSVVVSLIPVFDHESVSVLSLFVAPLLEVLFSAAIGIILGLILGVITRIYRNQGGRLIICIGFVLLTVALSEIAESRHWYLSGEEGRLTFSPLLMSITMGGAFSFVNHEHGIRKILDAWTYPMFVAFFVLAGAGFDIRAFTSLNVLWIAGIYIISRLLGKYYGTYLGCRLVKESKKMQKTLGVTLLPQADVALGMASLAALVLSTQQGSMVVSVILVAAIIFEIGGHIWIRKALKTAGEVHGDIDEELMKEEPAGEI